MALVWSNRGHTLVLTSMNMGYEGDQTAHVKWLALRTGTYDVRGRLYWSYRSHSVGC